MKDETKKLLLRIIIPLLIGFVSGDVAEREHWLDVFNKVIPLIQIQQQN